MLSTVLKWSSRAATRASPTCAASATRCAAYHRHQSTSATTSPSSPSVSPPAYIPPPPAAEISYTARAAVDRLRDGAPANDLSRFINFTMDTGDKRAIVEEHVRDGLLLLHRRTNRDPVELFHTAVTMLTPVLEVVGKKQGAKMVRVPLPVAERRGKAYVFRWLRDTLRKKRRPAVPFAEKFAAEVLAVLQGTSPLLSRRAEMHREALANRSQAPARWGIGYKV